MSLLWNLFQGVGFKNGRLFLASQDIGFFAGFSCTYFKQSW